MNSIKISLKNNKKYFKIGLILLFIGFFIGFILVKKLNIEPILENIKSISNYLNNNKINFLLNHILTLTILAFASLTIIGLILFPLNIIYEGICIFFNIYSFSKVFKFNGFIYGIIYSILTKALYLILVLIIIKKIIGLLKSILLKNDKTTKKTLIIKDIKHISIYLSILIINDLLIYLVGNRILAMFLFIIK